MQFSVADVQNLIEDGKIGVSDSGEKFADRYVVWLEPERFPPDIWGVYGFTMSEHPNHPQGCNVPIFHDFAPGDWVEYLPIERIPTDVVRAIALRLSD